jgi:hypothetical protein
MTCCWNPEGRSIDYHLQPGCGVRRRGFPDFAQEYLSKWSLLISAAQRNG